MVNFTMLHQRAWAGAHHSVLGLQLVGGEPLKSVTHDQCHASPMVTSPAAEHHRPLAGYCSVTEARVYKQPAPDSAAARI